MKNISVQANVTVNFQWDDNKEVSIKVFMFLTPCYLFLYINGMMIITLTNRATFLEKPRYVLFAHMLYTDSLQLALSAILYLLLVTGVYLAKPACLSMLLVLTVLTRISPLNLMLMSLERFVAICFPLRHTQMYTVRRTRLFIGLIWVMSSLESLTQLFVFVAYGITWSDQMYCSRVGLFGMAIYEIIYNVFSSLTFIVTSLTILYTYVAILRAAKSVGSNQASASKANKTVLLHLIQLVLCLSSILFSALMAMIRPHLHGLAYQNVQYFLFITLSLFPRCLSPLIYGLRDKTFSHWFRYYFSFCRRCENRPVPTHSAH